jgi:undecaprenyl-diphosphatase
MNVTTIRTKPNPRDFMANLMVETKNKSRVIWTAAIGVVVVVLVGLLIKNSHFDLAVVQFLNDYHQGKIGTFTNAVYKFFGPLYAIAGTVILTGVVIILTRSLRIGSTFAATIAATWLSLAAVKLIVHRARPDASLLSLPFDPAQVDASYPSGHAAFITALVVTLFLGTALGYRRWWVGIIGGLAIVLVGTSLVIDGVHFPSDVLGSMIWGIAVAPLARLIWVSVVLRAYDSFRARSPKSL